MKIKAQTKIDEFAFILLGAIVFIAILAAAWVASPSGGIVSVYPEKLVFHLSPGESATQSITINGSGIMEAKPSGEISSWIKPEYSKFNVAGGGSLGVTVKVPSTVSLGVYKGKLMITSNETTKSVDITVYVENVTRFKKRVITLPDFSIAYAGSSKNVWKKTNVDLTGDNKLTTVVSFSPEELKQLSSLTIKLIVDDTNNFGDLEVLLNGKEIYKSKISEGEIEIPLNVSLLKENNVITLKMIKNGWMFWKEPHCHLYSISIVADYNSIFKDFTFSMKKDEINNFKSFEFSALVRSSMPTPLLKVKINNQIVYLDKPPLTAVNFTFEKDLLGNPLILKENNTLAFSLASEGSMSFSNVLFKILTKG